MTDLERFRACMAYEPVDRAPYWDWGAWPETVECRQGEGYDPAQFDPAADADKRRERTSWGRFHRISGRNVSSAWGQVKTQ